MLSTDTIDRQNQRDQHIRLIALKGRMGWQKLTGYGRRNLVETTIGRYKQLIGSRSCELVARLLNKVRFRLQSKR